MSTTPIKQDNFPYPIFESESGLTKEAEKKVTEATEQSRSIHPEQPMPDNKVTT